MKILKQIVEEPLAYTGHQLKPLWIYENLNLQGNSVVSFRGPCRVDLPEMVDVEDIKNDCPIYSDQMVHFMAEFFDDGANLNTGVLRQRLWIQMIREILEEEGVKNLQRKGDDLFFEGRKLSVSIATASALSTLIHIGLNLTNDGTPDEVPTANLMEMGIQSVAGFQEKVLGGFVNECESIWLARCKVQPRTH